jgi:hypothetical protein
MPTLNRHGRYADALGRLERVALAPRQSFLNLVLVVVLVLVLDFRDASDNQPFGPSMQSFSPAPALSCGGQKTRTTTRTILGTRAKEEGRCG